jgi:hypothetical protein
VFLHLPDAYLDRRQESFGAQLFEDVEAPIIQGVEDARDMGVGHDGDLG